MIRGTTAQFKFNLPYTYDELSTAKIVFWQPGNNGPSTDRPLPIVKTLEYCSKTETPGELCVTLTQEETLRFSDESKAYVQFRGCTIEGYSFASLQEQVTVYPVYDDSILGDIVIPTPSDDGTVLFDGGTIA